MVQEDYNLKLNLCDNIFSVLVVLNGMKYLKMNSVYSEYIRHALYIVVPCVIAGSYDGCVYCINLHSGVIKWSFHTEGLVKSSPALCLNGSAIVFGSYDQFLYCIDILVCCFL